MVGKKGYILNYSMESTDYEHDHDHDPQWAKKPNIWTFVDISVTLPSVNMKIS